MSVEADNTLASASVPPGFAPWLVLRRTSSGCSAAGGGLCPSDTARV
jgi:hypothetical protein